MIIIGNMPVLLLRLQKWLMSTNLLQNQKTSNNYSESDSRLQCCSFDFRWWDYRCCTLGSRIAPLKTTLKYHSASSNAQSSHSSLYKQGQEHGHAYTSLSVILLLCPACHLLTHYCLSSIPPHHHPRSSPPLLQCTQTQHDASCNHCWTQFQGQFEDYLLSLVNKKQGTSIFWIFTGNLLTGL